MFPEARIPSAAGVWADSVVLFTLRVRAQPAVQVGGVEPGGVVGVWLILFKMPPPKLNRINKSRVSFQHG